MPIPKWCSSSSSSTCFAPFPPPFPDYCRKKTAPCSVDLLPSLPELHSFKSPSDFKVKTFWLYFSLLVGGSFNIAFLELTFSSFCLLVCYPWRCFSLFRNGGSDYQEDAISYFAGHRGRYTEACLGHPEVWPRFVRKRELHALKEPLVVPWIWWDCSCIWSLSLTRQKKGPFGCYFVSDCVTFSWPAEVDDLPITVQQKLFDEVLDRGKLVAYAIECKSLFG